MISIILTQRNVYLSYKIVICHSFLDTDTFFFPQVSIKHQTLIHKSTKIIISITELCDKIISDLLATPLSHTVTIRKRLLSYNKYTQVCSRSVDCVILYYFKFTEYIILYFLSPIKFIIIITFIF